MIEWFGPVIDEYYASTEGVGGTIIFSDEWLAKPGSVGKARNDNVIVIMDDDGTILPAGGRSGRSTAMTPGRDPFEYFKDPDKTDAVRGGASSRTVGDVGYLDEDGYLFLSDRKADMIISGGVNIYPAEIESVLITHPAVADVAVFGIPNAEWGEEVKAVVELLPDQQAGRRARPRRAARIPGRPHRALQAARSQSTSSTPCRAIRTASCTNAACATRTGRIKSARSSRFRHRGDSQMADHEGAASFDRRTFVVRSGLARRWGWRAPDSCKPAHQGRTRSPRGRRGRWRQRGRRPRPPRPACSCRPTSRSKAPSPISRATPTASTPAFFKFPTDLVKTVTHAARRRQRQSPPSPT